MMKSIYHKLLLALSIIALHGCGYNDFDAEPPLPEVEVPLQIPVAQLRSMYHGETYHIKDNLVLTAYVSSSDRHGNFSRVLYVDDGSQGLMIMTGLYDTHTNYKPGSMVHINLKGMAMDLSNNTLRIGRPDNGHPAYIGNAVLLDDIITRDRRTRTTPPRKVSVTGLTADDVGSLVTVEHLRADAIPGDTWAKEWPGYGSIYTNVRFSAAGNGSIHVSTSAYADFAGEAVPSGTVSITGIVVCEEVNGHETFLLRISSPDDVTEE